ncbi:serine/threonine-protein phosphatase CPPED1-like isoform X2 [Lycorma delicatula]
MNDFNKDQNIQPTEWKILTSHHKHVSFNEVVEKQWIGEFYFVQGADTQFGLIDRYLLNLEEPNWDKEIALTEETIRRINKMRPKPNFLVICGDLCDAIPDLTPELRKQQEIAFKSITSKLDRDIPLVCVCGNHDCGDQPNYKAVEMYRSSFGDDYFSFWSGGIFFIVINSQYYVDGTLIPDLVKEQEEWLDKQFDLYHSHCQTNQADGKECIGPVLFQHVPWFLDDPYDKNTGYFAIPYETRITMLDKLINCGVKYVFSGHLHSNSGGSYKGLEVIVTSAIGGQIKREGSPEYKSGVRIVKVSKNNLKHKYYAIEELPVNVNACTED